MYEIGVRNFSITRFTPTGVGQGESTLGLSIDKLIEVLYLIERLKPQLPEANFLLANSVPLCALPKDLCHYCNYCHFGSSRFYVDVHGNLLMCGMSRVRIGNIMNDTLQNIKKKSVDFRNLVTGTGFPEECRNCRDFARCRGGCRAAALAYSGSYCGKDPLCCYGG
ncbi:MAG: SPASM domain-containing protein [Alphaproteobacteria bacterium]|nr:SPASM domain-containing protein [Alphaproteobacteria bacterium]